MREHEIRTTTLFRTMARIRLFELKLREVYRSGVMPGFIHLYAGEEAVATGICANLNADDYVTSTHRGHGHAIAKGVPGGTWCRIRNGRGPAYR